jgi:hypothetical protein
MRFLFMLTKKINKNVHFLTKNVKKNLDKGILKRESGLFSEYSLFSSHKNMSLCRHKLSSYQPLLRTHRDIKNAAYVSCRKQQTKAAWDLENTMTIQAVKIPQAINRC